MLENLSPYGEPQLGKRGDVSDDWGQAASDDVIAMLGTLADSHGQHSVLDIAEVSDLAFTVVYEAAIKLTGAQLLDQFDPGGMLIAEP